MPGAKQYHPNVSTSASASISHSQLESEAAPYGTHQACMGTCENIPYEEDGSPRHLGQALQQQQQEMTHTNTTALAMDRHRD